MIKISDALQEIFDGNEILGQGLQEGLLNLSEVARKIHPIVEARVQKEVQVSALIMNLSRMAKRYKTIQKKQKFRLKNIHMNSGLMVFTADNSTELERKIHKLYTRIKETNGYITVSQGVHETTCIIDEDHFFEVEKILGGFLKSVVRDVSAIGVTFDKEYFETPGLISKVLRALDQQGINVVELASTYTELTLYISSDDRTLCFDTLQRKFF